VEHPAAERPGRLPLICYASGVGVMGYPRHLVTDHHRAQVWHHPGAEVRRRRVFLVASLRRPVSVIRSNALSRGRRGGGWVGIWAATGITSAAQGRVRSGSSLRLDGFVRGNSYTPFNRMHMGQMQEGV
jgi:hypothetical protein